jgi:hypothetical protein
MSRRRGPRYLVVGEDRFLWSIGHLHEQIGGAQTPPIYLDCRDIVTIRRHRSRGRLDVVFRDGEDRLVPYGMVPGGAVTRGDGRALNLHEPGTARALLDEALSGGWRPDVPEPVEFDGWVLFDAVYARRGRPGDGVPR